MPSAMTRRSFVAAAGAAALARADELIIDTHQHVHFHGRGDEALVAHQRTMGAASTVLLPGGSKAPLDAQVTGNETALAIVRRYPREFFYFANEDPTLPGASKVIEKHLKTGAIGIGEQKFHVECDSKWMVEVAEVAREFRVPVIMHFEHERYNMGIERFHKMPRSSIRTKLEDAILDFQFFLFRPGRRKTSCESGGLFTWIRMAESPGESAVQ